MEIFKTNTNHPLGELMEYLYRCNTYSNDINVIFSDLINLDGKFYNVIRKFTKNQPLGEIMDISIKKIEEEDFEFKITYISNDDKIKTIKTTMNVMEKPHNEEDQRGYVKLQITTLVRFKKKYNI